MGHQHGTHQLIYRHLILGNFMVPCLAVDRLDDSGSKPFSKQRESVETNIEWPVRIMI